MKLAILGMAASALILTTENIAFAYSYIAESINDWSGCDADCSDQNKLKYTDDQIKMFSGAMSLAGWYRSAWWRDQDVWGTDVEDDFLSGEDYLYADYNTVYIYSGHGSANQSG